MGNKLSFGDITGTQNMSAPASQAPTGASLMPVASPQPEPGGIKGATNTVNELAGFLEGVQKIANILVGAKEQQDSMPGKKERRVLEGEPDRSQRPDWDQETAQSGDDFPSWGGGSTLKEYREQIEQPQTVQPTANIVPMEPEIDPVQGMDMMQVVNILNIIIGVYGDIPVSQLKDMIIGGEDAQEENGNQAG